ncbi:YifB family Mg chelatase-like AAA ATPase [Fusibacter paucivorans]|uniref:YifB family Mg chelatase-like AAA ATPase n=1 Tax=Fusibacter paucivorans TaxID=76009 RepID=A0ABS5PT84_9FIRM|nr:YifB family Mg chelatase-like AAA ATPase [Fusibacter paucivorans]MBS7528385.1 YifB family Mg chelatase-like AAA ATPase [Fusibacter paucivorans]
MYSKLSSAVMIGIDGYHVEVETHLQNGMPQYHIVGLPGPIIRESKERVRAAIVNSGMAFPLMRMTQNMSPAHLKKEGAQLDLALALGILAAQNEVLSKRLSSFGVIGELTLDGMLKPVSGIYSLLEGFRSKGIDKVIMPADNVCPRDVYEEMMLYGVSSLKELVEALMTDALMPSVRQDAANQAEKTDETSIDYSEIIGQANAVRALEIALAGHHNILFVGPPGCGKTMILKRLKTVLTKPSVAERIEISKIHGLTNPEMHVANILNRPIRTPHHTISRAGMLGGGLKCLPGEVSKAHLGILVLDELSEFKTEVIDALREPLSTGEIALTKGQNHVVFPAAFQLVATMNPCFCGYKGSQYKACTCSESRLRQYHAKLSGPMLDRMDMIVYMDRVPADVFRQKSECVDSTAMASNICRYQLIKQNKHTMLEETIQNKLHAYYENGKLSLRSLSKIEAIARTIAGLEGSTCVNEQHLFEAIYYYGENLRQTEAQ